MESWVAVGAVVMAFTASAIFLNGKREDRERRKSEREHAIRTIAGIVGLPEGEVGTTAFRAHVREARSALVAASAAGIRASRGRTDARGKVAAYEAKNGAELLQELDEAIKLVDPDLLEEKNTLA